MKDGNTSNIYSTLKEKETRRIIRDEGNISQGCNCSSEKIIRNNTTLKMLGLQGLPKHNISTNVHVWEGKVLGKMKGDYGYGLSTSGKKME